MNVYRFIVGIITLVLTLIIVNQWKFDNNWDRPINSDGKGYYAYLPAIFIYQDLSYSFVDEMEVKYYSEDGSQAKAFRMKQPNGTIVNKCFPGVAIFYLPFFLLAIVFSWLFNFPIDGYSALFQWSVALAHLFYLFIGLLALRKAFSLMGINKLVNSLSLIFVVFATNIYFYLVYDFTVAHVFGFSAACVLIYWCAQYKKTKNLKYILWMLPLFAFLLLTRPTNALLIITLPLVLGSADLKELLQFKLWLQLKHIKWVIIAALILCIAPILWKAQSGNWLVYSYGNEKIDLTNPHFIDFLTSYIQGWWLWTPFMAFAFLLGSIYFWKQSKFQGLIYSLGVLGVVYIFSSWSTWTFGMSFGQRPMIEFYPLIMIGFVGFFNERKWKWSALIFTPLLILNVIQAYQMRNFIIVGGDTNKEDYWNRFLQLRPDAPSVKIEDNWKEMQRIKKSEFQVLDEKVPFSHEIRLKSLKKGSKVVVNTKIGGKKEKTNATLVLSDETGKFYKAHYIHEQLRDELTSMSFLFDIEENVQAPIKCYIWNGDSKEQVQLESLEVIQYIPVKK